MTPGRWWRRARPGTGRPGLSRRSRQDLLAALGVPQPDRAGGSIAFLRRRVGGEEPGCPACRVADEETRRWFFFYETETNADETLRERLVAAGGMCAPHTRRLMDQGASSSWLGKSLFDLLVRDARAHPHGAPGRRSEPCPVCAAVQGRVEDLLAMLASALVPQRGAVPTGRGPGAPDANGWDTDGWDAGGWDTGGWETGEGEVRGPVAGQVAARDRTAAGVPRATPPDLAVQEVVAAYRAGTGLCVPHTREFVSTAPARATALVAEVLADRLATTPELAAGLLTGDDTDAPARARLRAAAAPGVLRADATARRAGLPDRIEALLARPSCPVCAARDTTTWRLLDWIGSGRALPTRTAQDRVESDGPRVPDAGQPAFPKSTGPALVRRDGGRPRARPATGAGVRDQLAAVCADHLADLVRSDGDGGWLSEPVATVVRLAAARWRDAATAAAGGAAAGGAVAGGGLPIAPGEAGTVGSAARTDGSRGWSRPRTAAQLLTPTTACLVCTQAAQAADREVVLLRLVGADPARSARVAASHGPCQRCRAVVTGPTGSEAGLSWDRAATARVAELAFELTDALRQDSWTARWDVRGAELSAWRRAPARLDGAVLGPPPSDPSPPDALPPDLTTGGGPARVAAPTSAGPSAVVPGSSVH